ncbi:MAG: tetratricopeptide repeat protein, partial [Bacteroidia bacterium]
MNKGFLILIQLVCITTFSLAQKEKGDKYFENGQYARAIPKYEKASKKENAQQQDVLIKLGDCYRILNDYKNAEQAYRKALALKGTLPAEFRYNYGSVLKSNHNYSEALYQFMAYVEEKPNDAKAKNAVKSCQEMKYWMRRAIEYEVKNVEGLNSPKSEYCPTLFNNKLVYVSDKQSDYLEMDVNDIDGQPYTNIYISNVKLNKSGKQKSFSDKINTSADDGPVNFSADGKTLLFTRVDNKTDKKNKNFVNQAKIYFATGKDQKWGDIKEFKYNSDDYSVAHPCLSPDGNYLFFTSDMKGGQGGKDLWYCKKSGDSWEKPVNLGTDVNTSGNEMFPYVKKDGTLYFSSSGLAGFGGLDIFTAKEKEGKWIVSRNESMHLNSNADDFGICFLTDTTGYFSSNREGGEGKDDIWWFKFTSRYITVAGSVLLTENINDPAKNVKVYLKTPDGKKLDSVRTNAKGYFDFKNLDNDKKYLAVVDSDDPALQGKARYYMADTKGVVMRVSGPNGPDKYAFKNLPFDPNGLPDLYTSDDLTLAGNMLYGENPSKPIKNTKINITNKFGDVVESTTTNEFGAFAF